MKKVFFISLFLLFWVNQVFALSGKVTVDKNNIAINEPVNVKISLEVNEDEMQELNLISIPNLEDNFRVIGAQQAQQMSTSREMKNGEFVQETLIHLDRIFQLQATKTGEFSIGPVIIQSGNQEVRLNPVEVTVSETPQFIKNNEEENIQNEIDEDTKKETSLEKENQLSSFFENNGKYFLIFIIFWILFLIIQKFASQKRNQKLEPKLEKNVQNPSEEFEKKQYFLPEIESEYFVEELELYIKSLLYKQYKISHIESMTKEEIISQNNISPNKREVLKQIYADIYSMKYSQNLVSKSELLELAKQL